MNKGVLNVTIFYDKKYIIYVIPYCNIKSNKMILLDFKNIFLNVNA